MCCHLVLQSNKKEDDDVSPNPPIGDYLLDIRGELTKPYPRRANPCRLPPLIISSKSNN